MYKTAELQAKILQLKKEKGVCILAHAYQTQDVTEIADYVGDSYGLSVKAAAASEKTVIMCGVRFMAETVKILSPDKRVILSHKDAGCPMAEQLTAAEVKELKRKFPDYAVVAYINTTSELKTVCDVCVTSASAVKVIRNMKEKNILFIPDCNLGAWVKEQIPEKHFEFVKGGCPVHTRITEEDAKRAKAAHPNAKILVHPECPSAVVKHADYAGSTTGIMDYVKKSADREFVIGTENSIVQHLQFDCPDKKFYALSKNCVCNDMKLTTLADVYACLTGEGGEEIIVPKEVADGARRCIDKMLELGR